MNWFKKIMLALRIIGVVGQELAAITQDNKITVSEGLYIVKTIAFELGYSFDDEGVDLEKLLKG